MVVKTIEITNPSGLHARPAAMFVQTAGKFTSDIWIEKRSRKVNAKSIMGLISLTVSCGEQITLSANGEDAQIALEELLDLIKSGFGE